MNNVAWFLVISAFIYVLLEAFKKFQPIGNNKWFRFFLPFIPIVLGIGAGMAVGPYIIEGNLVGYAILGGLAGGMSSSGHKMMQRILERDARLNE